MTSKAFLRKKRRTRGSVLIVMMWLVLALCGLVLVFAQSVKSSATAEAYRESDLDAEMTAMSAIEYVKAKLDSTGGDAEELSDESFDAVAAGKGIFWVLNIPRDGSDEMAYGPTDEAGLLNINSASREMLLKLPGMTEELASSIIDWRDEDSEVSSNGAENEYYQLLSDGYQCKNADFENIEEILLVRGGSEDVLFGTDKNRNGMSDDSEADATGDEDVAATRTLNGNYFYHLITVSSYEKATTSEGTDKINVNDTYSTDLSNLIKEAVSSDSRYYRILENIRSGGTYDNLLQFYYTSGLKLEEMESIEDKLIATETTSSSGSSSSTSEETVTGLININTAPEAVLLCLPGLEQNDVDKIVNKRDSTEEEETGIVWITEVLDQEKAEAIGTYITSKSYCFSADIVAVSSDGRAYRRLKAVFDMNDGSAKLLSCQDLTHLGWPLSWQILQQLRTGTDPSDIATAGRFGE